MSSSLPLRFRLLDGSARLSGYITKCASVRVGLHDTEYNVTALVIWLDQRSPLVLGLDFLRKECPHLIGALQAIGRTNSPSLPPTVLPSPASRLPTVDVADRDVGLQAHSRQDLQCFEDTEICSLVEEHTPFRHSSVEAVARLGGEKLAQGQPKGIEPSEEYAGSRDVFDLDYDKSPPASMHGAICAITTTDNHLPLQDPPFPCPPRTAPRMNDS